MSELVEMERRLWTDGAGAYEDTLVEDAVFVFAETGPISRDAAIEGIRANEARRWIEVNFEDVRVSKLAADAQLLLYRFSARRENDEKRMTGLASSVYVNRGAGWKLAFHQQTPLS